MRISSFCGHSMLSALVLLHACPSPPPAPLAAFFPSLPSSPPPAAWSCPLPTCRPRCG